MNAHSTYRIGIDARFYRKETAGIGRYTRELLSHLFAMDQNNEYFVFLTEADIAEWTIDQPNVHPVVVPIAHYSMKEQTAFLKVLYSYKLDLVHFLSFNHPVLYRRPFVVTLHDLTLFHFRKPEHPVKAFVRSLAFGMTIRHALQGAKRVISVSEYSAHDAEKTLHIPHPKMNVIYEGSPQPVQLLPGAKDAVRKYIGTSDPYFLFLGDWRPHKGLVTLLDAFGEFKTRTGLPHKLVICGKQASMTDELRERLVSTPAASDIITPGFAPEELLPALYYYATSLVFPSEYEGFGLPVLEAFAYGTPAICARATSLPEVGGEAAAYFEVRNAHSLSEQIEKLATDTTYREKLIGKAAKQLRHFSWQHCAEETLATYIGVLEKHR